MVYPSAVLAPNQTLLGSFSTPDRPLFASSVSLPGLDEDDDFEPTDDPAEGEHDPFEPPEAEDDDAGEDDGDADEDEDESDSSEDAEDDEDEDDAAGELDFGT